MQVCGELRVRHEFECCTSDVGVILVSRISSNKTSAFGSLPRVPWVSDAEVSMNPGLFAQQSYFFFSTS